MKAGTRIAVPWKRRFDELRFKFGPALVFAIILAAVVVGWPEYVEIPSGGQGRFSGGDWVPAFMANTVTQETSGQFGQVD